LNPEKLYEDIINQNVTNEIFDEVGSGPRPKTSSIIGLALIYMPPELFVKTVEYMMNTASSYLLNLEEDFDFYQLKNSDSLVSPLYENSDITFIDVLLAYNIRHFPMLLNYLAYMKLDGNYAFLFKNDDFCEVADFINKNEDTFTLEYFRYVLKKETENTKKYLGVNLIDKFNEDARSILEEFNYFSSVIMYSYYLSLKSPYEDDVSDDNDSDYTDERETEGSDPYEKLLLSEENDGGEFSNVNVKNILETIDFYVSKISNETLEKIKAQDEETYDIMKKLINYNGMYKTSKLLNIEFSRALKVVSLQRRLPSFKNA